MSSRPFCSAYAYDAMRAERLSTGELEAEQLYTFMMRLRGNGLEAFCLPASVTDVRPLAGALAVLLCLKKANFEDLVRTEGQVEDGLWTPNDSDPLIIETPYSQARGAEGYFLPFEDVAGPNERVGRADRANELVFS